MNRTLVLAVAVALMVGLWGGVVLGRAGGGRYFEARTGEAPPPRAADAPRPGPHTRGGEGMAFTRLRIDTAGEQPKACLQFTRPLSTNPETRFQDFLELEPAAPYTAEANGALLCLSGLPFEPDRKVTIKPGLPARDGAKTARAEEFTLSFGDRPAFLGFLGQGVILPRTEADGLALESVNVSKIKVEVLRVPDRALARESIDVGAAVAEGSWNWYGFKDAGADAGVPVYTGTIDVPLRKAGADRRNETVTTVFPLGAALKEFRPGAYVVKLEDVSPGAGGRGETDRPAAAHRWILYTDMALQTFEGAGGMDVVARSLQDAKPMNGVSLALVAANNDELARIKSNGEGRARFPAALLRGEGAARARYVMAYGPNGDFTALDLERPALDLSNHTVDGRAARGEVDSYVYTDRGIYRPGEVVRVAAMLRDAAGRAIENRRSTLIVYRPNGTVARRDRLSEAREAGAVIKNVRIDASAPRGRWRAALEVDGQEGAAGEAAFAVEDFVPQRLAVEAKTSQAPLRAGESRAIEVSARFLYGAPGAGLAVEGEVRLEADPNPFPTLKGYSFGRAQEAFEERFIELPAATTDGDGRAALTLAFREPVETTLPLRARVTASVFEPGGRTVREGFTIPVRFSERYFGVKPGFEGGQVGEGAPAQFSVVAVDQEGARVRAPGVRWRLVEEDWSYDWYLEDGAWKWRRTGRDIPVAGAGGRLDLGTGAVAAIGRDRLPAGDYRLIVQDEAGPTETAYRFSVGYGAGGDERDTPDRVSVTTPPDPVAPGGRVRVRIKPPYAGQAQIVVATDRVLEMKTVSVTEKGTSVDLRAGKEWGAGAYVMVTVMTPRAPGSAPAPRRAVGVAYAAVDMGKRTLTLDLAKGLEQARPRTRITVPLTIAGVPRGESLRVTLAAVDEGILGLTKFESPDPTGHYFGRKALGVALRDDYGRLLNPNLGAPAIARQGGDGLGGEGLTVVPSKTVALWSGLVKPDKAGKVSIPLDLPDFNGRLRLMAVAWSETALGAAAKPLIVRDPVVAELTLPRFLAPGDEASATLELSNVEGGAGAYQVEVAGSGAVRAEPFRRTFDLARGSGARVRVPVSGAGAGLGQVRLAVRGPNGFAVERAYDIETRTPFLPITDARIAEQGAGQAFRLDPGALSAFAPGEGRVLVSYSNLRGMDPGALLDVLDRYPYGCSEQLVSTALPLLYSDVLAGAARRPGDPKVRARVQQAVNKLLDRQSADGAFGLWREGDRAATPWLGVYVADFLRRAKAAGYVVPEAPMTLAYQGLRAVARLDDFAAISYDFEVLPTPGSNDSTERLRSRAGAYALYVLAKGGKADIGQVRYFHDARLKSEPSPLARAQIGAALAHLGDRARAASAFKEAEQALGYRNTGDYYQSPLRDVAGVLALAAEAGQGAMTERLARRLDREQPDPDALMTQEQAQLLLAADALVKRAGPVSIALNGGPAGALAPVSADAGEIGRGLVFRNAGQGPVWRTMTASGAPKSAPPAAAAGFTLDKRLYTLAGARVDPSALAQGARVIVLLSGAPQGQRLHPAVLVDLLPAGLEIESVLKPEDGAREAEANPEARGGPFAWAGPISAARIAEARDDRFVAAADVRGRSFRFGYIARAVTPGAYAIPGAQIEDMYRPGVYARTPAGRLRIAG